MTCNFCGKRFNAAGYASGALLTCRRCLRFHEDAYAEREAKAREAQTVICPPGTEYILPGYKAAVNELLAAIDAPMLPGGTCEWVGRMQMAARKVHEAQGVSE